MACKSFTLWLTHTHTQTHTPSSEAPTMVEMQRGTNCPGWSTERKTLLFKGCTCTVNSEKTDLLYQLSTAREVSGGTASFELCRGCVYCYRCYSVWRSPEAQRATSSVLSLSSHRSSGGGRTGDTGWEGTGTHTWWTDYCSLWPWYLQKVT